MTAAIEGGIDRGTESGGRTSARWNIAFAQPDDVFRLEYERLVQTLTIVAGDRETAADAVQEAFIRLVDDWERIRRYDDPAGWVRRVALNRITDHRRRLRRRARAVLRLERQQQAWTPPPSPGDEKLWEVLRTLPVRQRTAMALCYVGDYTMREVAEIMGISEGSVKQHLSRARETARAALEKGS